MSEQKNDVINAIINNFRQEKQPLLTYVVPPEFSKKIGSYLLIRNDIDDIIKYVNRLIEIKEKREADASIECDEITESSLWYATIVRYGKCFNQNDGGHTKLEANDIFRLPEDKEYKEIHEMLMSLRNGFVAHRDDTENEQAVVVMRISLEGSNEYTIFDGKSLTAFSPSIQSLKNYIKLFLFLLPKIYNKIQKQAERTRNKFLGELTAEEIHKHLLL